MYLRSSRGFTTFELVVVATVAIVVFSFGVPRVQETLSSGKLGTSAQQLATDLNFARSAAVSRNSVYRLVINKENGSFQLVDPVLGDLIRSTRTLDRGISFVSVPGTPIQFFPRGHALSGTIVLKDDYGRYMTVSVQRSGMVAMGSFRTKYE